MAALTVFAAFNMESCSSNKGTVSCPDLHGSHHSMAMHWKMHNPNHESASATHTSKTQPGDKTVKAAAPGVDKVNPTGIASLSNEIPKTPMGIFKILTSDERAQVKQQISSLMVKKPMLNKLINKRFEKLDHKYPAPAQSVLKAGGGGLSIGEILAIVAIACCVTWVLGLAGMIIGIVALLKINKEGGAKWAKILAIVAIALGALEFLTFLLWLIFVVILVGGVGVI